MPERVADAIEEIARPDRGDQQQKPQIQADPALRRPRLIAQRPGMADVGDRACGGGGGGLGEVLGSRPSCGVGEPRPVVRWTAARARGRSPGRSGHHRRRTRMGIPARPDFAASSAHMDHGGAPSRPGDPAGRLADCSDRHRGRTGDVGDAVGQRRLRRAHRARQRRPGRQGGAARNCWRGDRRRARAGVSAPKGHGASAIRAAIRCGLGSAGRLGHGGSYRRCVRDGRHRRRERGFREAPAVHRCAVWLSASAI